MNARFQAPQPLLLPPTEGWTYEVSPLSHAALPGVDVLAYRPDSLVFAQIASMNRDPGTLNIPLAQ